MTNIIFWTWPNWNRQTLIIKTDLFGQQPTLKYTLSQDQGYPDYRVSIYCKYIFRSCSINNACRCKKFWFKFYPKFGHIYWVMWTSLKSCVVSLLLLMTSHNEGLWKANLQSSRAHLQMKFVAVEIDLLICLLCK